MLLDNQVYIAIARCSAVSDDEAEQYRPLLNPAELTRNARYRFRRDRHRDLIARALVRCTLSERLRCHPAELDFYSDNHGKPHLAHPALEQPLCFNLSHSGDWIALVVGNTPVGIDVEYTRRSNDLLAIADRYFFGDEYSELMSFPVNEREQRFFDYWTLKEAYMKARGEGLSLGLSNFGFSINKGIRLQLGAAIDDNESNWQFYCHTPEPEYRLALAVKHRAPLACIVEEVKPLFHKTHVDWSFT